MRPATPTFNGHQTVLVPVRKPNVPARQLYRCVFREAVRQLRDLDWESLATARAHELARGRLSNFSRVSRSIPKIVYWNAS